jgi:putative transposase
VALTAADLADPPLVICDGAPSIALMAVPDEVWQEFKARVQSAYQASSRAIARELAAGIVADCGREQERGVARFMDEFEACIAHLRFPVNHRRSIRTTNLLERLFVEVVST